ncbi:hypothetical protein WMY93_027155 [Mugilogobius chulae]|uniref:Uncharacterized protein n=1 Tax=Mugilogobius chulae TaxID=88201 RepID=A0AAW0MWH6_9GOBI
MWARSCMGDHEGGSLEAHDLKGLFVLLGLGLCIGVLLALLELLSKAHRQAKDHKAGPFSHEPITAVSLLPEVTDAALRPKLSGTSLQTDTFAVFSPCEGSRRGSICAEACGQEALDENTDSLTQTR